MEKVCIVIPAYKPELKENDLVALRSVERHLGHFPIRFAVPHGMDVSQLTAEVGGAVAEEFAPEYFAGIAGYNRLMMSEEFYSRFSGYEYILIFQLDAYVFSDRLLEWCGKGYDYVGGPWVVRPIYRFPLFRLFSWVKHSLRRRAGKPDLQATNWKVGNGGFSLRKVPSHLHAVRALRGEVERYLLTRHHIFNEDVFFSVEVNRHGLGFRYPGWEEALGFSFDKNPGLCMKLAGGRLPFGCHAWTKRKMRKFWKKVF